MTLQFVRFHCDGDLVSQLGTFAIGTTDHGHGTIVTDNIECHSVRLAQTEPGGTYDWNPAPRRQLVVTLSGRIAFEFGNGDTLEVGPGDVFLAEDLEGRGHKWHIVGEEPWKRLYVHLECAPRT